MQGIPTPFRAVNVDRDEAIRPTHRSANVRRGPSGPPISDDTRIARGHPLPGADARALAVGAGVVEWDDSETACGEGEGSLEHVGRHCRDSSRGAEKSRVRFP